MKRTIAVLLAALMVFALVGCGNKKRQIVQLTLSTEDSEAILAAAGIMLPDAEAAAATGTTVKYHHYIDAFHNYSEDEIIQTGYWTFKTKYNCEVEWIETTWSDQSSDLATLFWLELLRISQRHGKPPSHIHISIGYMPLPAIT